MGKSCSAYLQITCEILLSTMLCAFGVCLFVEAGIGSDTIDVLVDGMHQSFHMTLGQADQLFSIGFLILALLLNRQYIGIPSIAYTLIIGFAIDLVNQLIIPMRLSEQPFLIQLCSVMIGQLCFSLSYALFQTVERGMNALDAVIYFLVEKLHLSYVWLRTSFDLLFFVVGFSLGGVIGIGTLLSACCTGVLTKQCHCFIVKIKQLDKQQVNIEV